APGITGGAAVRLHSLRVTRYAAAAGRRLEAGALVGDHELVPAAVSLGPVEMVVAALERDEIPPVHRAAPVLERVVEAGERLDVLVGRALADGVGRERVQLLTGAGDIVAGELYADVPEHPAVVAVIGAARVLLGDAGRPLGLDHAAAVAHAVADDDQAAPVAGLARACRLLRGKDDRARCGALSDDARAAQNPKRAALGLEVADDLRARLDRKCGAVRNLHVALEDPDLVARERAVGGDRPG